jgi:hypothetical protein
MIRRLVEAHYFANNKKSHLPYVKFWLRELRTPALLLDVVQAHTNVARQFSDRRRLLRHALRRNIAQLERALAAEESRSRAQDKAYWLPLRKELEILRHQKATAELPD